MEKDIQTKFKYEPDGFSSSAADAVPRDRADLQTTHQAISSPSLVPVSRESQSPARPFQQHYDRDSRLERLPPELRDHVLSILDLDGLKALVQASPVYHGQYLSNRRHLLASCMDATLKTATVEAIVCYVSARLQFAEKYMPDAVLHCLDVYQARQALPRYSIMDDNPTTDEIADMAAFHLGIVRPLMQEYIAWSLGNLAWRTGTRPYNTKLSATEEMRLLRSMYRFQLWSNLFHICPDTQDRHGPRLDGWKLMELQFSFFEPWEVEEIFCIKTFAKVKFDHIFSRIHRDLCPGPPAIPGQQRSMPAGFFDFDHPFTRDCLLNGTIALGLNFLHTVLFKIKDHDHLVSTMRNHIGRETFCFLNNDDIGLIVQNKRRRSKPSLRDRKQGRRDPLPFLGDVLVPSTDTTHPPLAWTLIWEGTYSSLVGYFIKDKVRKWGYVMWDAARLEKTGAKEVLKRQWESDWLGQDPRDIAIS